MGVVQIGGWNEGASLNISPNLGVGIAEGHSFEHEIVYGFYGIQEGVARVSREFLGADAGAGRGFEDGEGTTSLKPLLAPTSAPKLHALNGTPT